MQQLPDYDCITIFGSSFPRDQKYTEVCGQTTQTPVACPSKSVQQVMLCVPFRFAETLTELRFAWNLEGRSFC